MKCVFIYSFSDHLPLGRPSPLLRRGRCFGGGAVYGLPFVRATWRCTGWQSHPHPPPSLQGSLRSRLRRFKEDVGVGRCWEGWWWLAVSTDSLWAKTKHKAKEPLVKAFWKCAVISFGKARAIIEAGVDSSVLDCFKKSEATPPNGINQRFPPLQRPALATHPPPDYSGKGSQHPAIH